MGIGRRIQVSRKAKHLTVLQLAQSADCSDSAIWGIEAGRSMPSLKMAIRLAEALDITLDYLIRGVR